MPRRFNLLHFIEVFYLSHQLDCHGPPSVHFVPRRACHELYLPPRTAPISSDAGSGSQGSSNPTNFSDLQELC